MTNEREDTLKRIIITDMDECERCNLDYHIVGRRIAQYIIHRGVDEFIEEYVHRYNKVKRERR